MSAKSPQPVGTKLVQMRLRPKTINTIANLANVTGVTSKTQLVSASVEIANEVLSSLKQGAHVYIEHPDGRRELLKVVGV
jgi:hypothetical protein